MKKSASYISSFRGVFLRVILPFLLLAGAGLPLFDAWFYNNIIITNTKTRTYKMHRLFNEQYPEEIPIFGSSTVYRGFLPDSLGPQFYNYGMYGSNFQKVRLLLEQELRKDKTTPIILDWHPRWLFRRDSVPIQMADYLPQTEHPEIKAFLQKYDYDKVWNTIPGIRYYGYYQGYIGEYGRRNFLPRRFGFNKGCKYFKGITPKAKFERFVKKRLKMDMTFTFDPYLAGVLDSLIESHPERTFVLVVSPLHESVMRAGGKLEPVQDYLAKLEQRFPNVVGLVYDGRTYEDEYFLDTMHLNYKGAKRFSANLRDQLKSRGIIP